MFERLRYQWMLKAAAECHHQNSVCGDGEDQMASAYGASEEQTVLQWGLRSTTSWSPGTERTEELDNIASLTPSMAMDTLLQLPSGV